MSVEHLNCQECLSGNLLTMNKVIKMTTKIPKSI